MCVRKDENTKLPDYKSFKQGFKDTYDRFENMLKELMSSKGKDLTMPVNKYIGVVASIFMAGGSLIGMGINDKLGGSIRDLFGIGGDLSLVLDKNPTAKKAGIFYIVGSVCDFLARFTSQMLKVFKVVDEQNAEHLRDMMHDWAIGFDKVGALFLYKYNQDDDLKAKEDEAFDKNKAKETETHTQEDSKETKAQVIHTQEDKYMSEVDKVIEFPKSEIKPDQKPAEDQELPKAA